MKIILTAIVILVIAIWLGMELHQENSQVLIHYGSWSIETTLWVAVVAIVVLFIILYMIIRIIQETQLWPGRLRLWGRARKRGKMLDLTHSGLIELMEGRWQLAEQHFDKSADFSPLPLLNYAGAAYAAGQYGNLERRNAYLQKIAQKKLLSPVQQNVLQAQLQIASHEWDQAEISLTQSYQHNPKQPQLKYPPKHPQVLRLLGQVYRHQQKWTALQPLLTPLHKLQLLPEAEWAEWMEQTARGCMHTAAQNQDAEALVASWRQVPPTLQRKLLGTYVRHLLEVKQDQQAMILIERFLKKNWDAELLASYAQIAGSNSNKQLAQAESWLQKHPQSPELLTCLGMLSMRSQLWGKAKEYLTAALAAQPSPSLHYQLAQVYERLQDKPAAMQHYREGLGLVVEDEMRWGHDKK